MTTDHTTTPAAGATDDRAAVRDLITQVAPMMGIAPHAIDALAERAAEQLTLRDGELYWRRGGRAPIGPAGWLSRQPPELLDAPPAVAVAETLAVAGLDPAPGDAAPTTPTEHASAPGDDDAPPEEAL